MSEYACLPKLFGREARGNMAFTYRTGYVCMPSEYSPLAFLDPVSTIFHPALCPESLAAWPLLQAPLPSGFQLDLAIGAHQRETRGREESTSGHLFPQLPLCSLHGLEPRETLSTQLSLSLSAFFSLVLVTILSHFPFRPSPRVVPHLTWPLHFDQAFIYFFQGFIDFRERKLEGES